MRGLLHHTIRPNAIDTWYCLNCVYRDLQGFHSDKTFYLPNQFPCDFARTSASESLINKGYTMLKVLQS